MPTRRQQKPGLASLYGGLPFRGSRRAVVPRSPASPQPTTAKPGPPRLAQLCSPQPRRTGLDRFCPVLPGLALELGYSLELLKRRGVSQQICTLLPLLSHPKTLNQKTTTTFGAEFPAKSDQICAPLRFPSHLPPAEAARTPRSVVVPPNCALGVLFDSTFLDISSGFLQFARIVIANCMFGG
ncbi:MAG: hypothetical protein JWQ04_709 [Pedosphaera sp.]|nr:hypothetical protein [Pedosphaera sp.]